jgi:hypothetical protein
MFTVQAEATKFGINQNLDGTFASGTAYHFSAAIIRSSGVQYDPTSDIVLTIRATGSLAPLAFERIEIAAVPEDTPTYFDVYYYATSDVDGKGITIAIGFGGSGISMAVDDVTFCETDETTSTTTTTTTTSTTASTSSPIS